MRALTPAHLRSQKHGRDTGGPDMLHLLRLLSLGEQCLRSAKLVAWPTPHSGIVFSAFPQQVWRGHLLCIHKGFLCVNSEINGAILAFERFWRHRGSFDYVVPGLSGCKKIAFILTSALFPPGKCERWHLSSPKCIVVAPKQPTKPHTGRPHVVLCHLPLLFCAIIVIIVIIGVYLFLLLFSLSACCYCCCGDVVHARLCTFVDWSHKRI